MLGLTAIAVILFSSNGMIGSAQQESQEESEGDLQVVLNGEVFTTGDTITISGSIDDPDDQPILNIEVVDPEGNVVARASPEITADDTFTFSFEAGGQDPFMLGDRPMTVSGNYRVTVTYLPSLTNIDEVDSEFEYIVTPRAEEESAETDGGGPLTSLTEPFQDLFGSEGQREEEEARTGGGPRTGHNITTRNTSTITTINNLSK